MGYDFKGSRFFPCTRVCLREFIGNGNNFQSCIVRPDLVDQKMRGENVFNLTVQNVHVHASLRLVHSLQWSMRVAFAIHNNIEYPRNTKACSVP